MFFGEAEIRERRSQKSSRMAAATQETKDQEADLAKHNAGLEENDSRLMIKVVKLLPSTFLVCTLTTPTRNRVVSRI
jgi:hypothetical protein